LSCLAAKLVKVAKISILLPVFNTAPFLGECLDSILAQTEPDWELLAVDDFSTDESLSILEKYERRDERIRVFSKEESPPPKNRSRLRPPQGGTPPPQKEELEFPLESRIESPLEGGRACSDFSEGVIPEKGIAPSLRLAFRQATGQLITRMDSDDRMLPQKLAALKNSLVKNGRGHVATGLIEYFSADGPGAGYRRYARWLNEVAMKGTHAENAYRECVIPSPCWMAWREDLEAITAFKDDIYPEDYDLCFRFLHAGFKIQVVPQLLHQWRDWPHRTSRTDERYADYSYLDLKAEWFARMNYDGSRSLVLWGAGRKGKRLARLFTQKRISFHWVCDNAGKWGKEIAGVTLENFEIIPAQPNPQIIVAVAAPDGQRGILDFFKKHSFEAGRDYFFFC
jgi:glycosyltransferase involved in cell wall biosynthesis